MVTKSELEDAHEELKAQVADMADDVKQIKAERDGYKAEALEWKQKYEAAKAAHDQKDTALHELMSKTGAKEVKPYEYKEGECRPVPVGGVCDSCGWVRETQMRPSDKQKEPHPIQL